MKPILFSMVIIFLVAIYSALLTWGVITYKSQTYFFRSEHVSALEGTDGLVAYLEGGKEVEIRDPNTGSEYLLERDVVGERANIVLPADNCLSFEITIFEGHLIANNSGRDVVVALPEANSYHRVACPRDVDEDGILWIDSDLEVNGKEWTEFLDNNTVILISILVVLSLFAVMVALSASITTSFS